MISRFDNLLSNNFLVTSANIRWHLPLHKIVADALEAETAVIAVRSGQFLSVFLI